MFCAPTKDITFSCTQSRRSGFATSAVHAEYAVKITLGHSFTRDIQTFPFIFRPTNAPHSCHYEPEKEKWVRQRLQFQRTLGLIAKREKKCINIFILCYYRLISTVDTWKFAVEWQKGFFVFRKSPFHISNRRPSTPFSLVPPYRPIKCWCTA